MDPTDVLADLKKYCAQMQIDAVDAEHFLKLYPFDKSVAAFEQYMYYHNWKTGSPSLKVASPSAWGVYNGYHWKTGISHLNGISQLNKFLDQAAEIYGLWMEQHNQGVGLGLLLAWESWHVKWSLGKYPQSYFTAHNMNQELKSPYWPHDAGNYPGQYVSTKSDDGLLNMPEVYEDEPTSDEEFLSSLVGGSAPQVHHPGKMHKPFQQFKPPEGINPLHEPVHTPGQPDVYHKTYWDPIVQGGDDPYVVSRCMQCTHTLDEQAQEKETCECCKLGHCLDCGQPGEHCICCQECEQYVCVCEPKKQNGHVISCECDDCDELEESNEYGKNFRKVPPWIQRGQAKDTSKLRNKYTVWQKAWPACANVENLDPCRAAADFYLLDALRHAVLNKEHDCDDGFGHCGHYELINMDQEIKMVQKDAERRYEYLVAILDQVFTQYVEMACGGELRHHPAANKHGLDHGRRDAWATWKAIREEIGWDGLLDMRDMFMDWGTHGGGYGGPKWGDAAKLLHDRMTNKITPAEWVDRVFALVHNGGVFLNKLGWGIQNPKQWDLGYLQKRVLPAHASDDFGILLRLAHPDVQRLWDEYWRCMNKARRGAGLRAQRNPRQLHRTYTLCTRCLSNPRVGHQMACAGFTKFEVMSYDADDMTPSMLKNYNSDELPIKPDGTIHMYGSTMLNVEWQVGNHWFNQHHKAMLSATQLFTKVVNLSTMVKNLQAHGDYGDAPEESWYWQVSISVPYSHNVLQTVKSGKTTAEKLKKVKLDLGIVFSSQQSKVDWSKVEDEFLNLL